MKALVDGATAGRHRGLKNFYIEHNLFHQIRLERDVELQNKHIFPLKSPGDVIQVSALSAQLDLGSELVDWYQNVTFIPLVNYWLSCRPEQTTNYVTAQKLDPFFQNLMSSTS